MSPFLIRFTSLGIFSPLRSCRAQSPRRHCPISGKTPARAFTPVTARAGVQEAPCRFRMSRSRTGRFPWVPAIWTFYFLAFCSRRYSCSIHRKSPAVGGCVMLLWAIFEKYPGFASHAFAMDVRMLRSTLVRVLPQRAAAAGYRPPMRRYSSVSSSSTSSIAAKMQS